MTEGDVPRTLIIVRHGQSKISTGRIERELDSIDSLTATGIAQSHSVARFLSNLSTDEGYNFYSSPLKRSRQTIEIITSHFQYSKSQVLNELNEFYRIDQIIDKLFFGGGFNDEDWRDYVDRVGHFIMNSIDELGNTCIFVTHAGWAAAVQLYFSDTPKNHPLGHGDVLVFQNGAWVYWRNDI